MAFKKRLALPAFASEPFAAKRELPTTIRRVDLPPAFFSSAGATPATIVTGPFVSLSSFRTPSVSSFESDVSPQPSAVVSTSDVKENAAGTGSVFWTDRARGKTVG